MGWEEYLNSTNIYHVVLFVRWWIKYISPSGVTLCSQPFTQRILNKVYTLSHVVFYLSHQRLYMITYMILSNISQCTDIRSEHMLVYIRKYDKIEFRSIYNLAEFLTKFNYSFKFRVFKSGVLELSFHCLNERRRFENGLTGVTFPRCQHIC